jgi:aminoglycoside phosphotransferase (APT) family kinase protein
MADGHRSRWSDLEAWRDRTAMRYSERLGEISGEQLQQALERFGLGALVSATPVPTGLFGQNVFITATSGDYVLRGKPHYDWQFPTEQFFARLLVERTRVPAPHPYLLDESTDVFGWSYVLMPRLHGMQLSDQRPDPAFMIDDLRQIAVAQATMLVEAQRLSWPRYGRYDPACGTIEVRHEPYAEWLYTTTHQYLQRAASYNTRTMQADFDWLDAQFAAAREALLEPFQPRFVHHDYKPSNMLVDRVGNTWQVTGLFDLMEAHFGNGEADLSRMFCFYVGIGHADLARLFVTTYASLAGDPAGQAERFAPFVLHDRAIVWEWLQRHPLRRQSSSQGSFREYVSSFLRYFQP